MQTARLFLSPHTGYLPTLIVPPPFELPRFVQLYQQGHLRDAERLAGFLGRRGYGFDVIGPVLQRVFGNVDQDDTEADGDGSP